MRPLACKDCKHWPCGDDPHYCYCWYYPLVDEYEEHIRRDTQCDQ